MERAAFFHSEEDFLALIHRYFPKNHPHISLGRGDDCAVFSCPESLCVTTDLFVEDVHFRTSYFSPQDIGYKALAVNLSDLAAMGAKPLGFSLALTTPGSVPASFWEGFFQGMSSLAGEYCLALTGGDLSEGQAISVSITAWGTPGRNILKRGQTQEGDVLVVVGNIGMARAGLGVLEEGFAQKGTCTERAKHSQRNKQEDILTTYPQCVARHLRPQPLLGQGRLLAGLSGVRGAMDVSDGLERDVPRFLASGQGADMSLPLEMIHEEVRSYCRTRDLEPARFCLRGGEDYALLAAVAPEEWDCLVAGCPDAWRLGTITDSGFYLNGQAITLRGFDHFSSCIE